MNAKLLAFKGLVDIASTLWGSVFARDFKEWAQSKLGPKYSDEQLASLDANWVDGLKRQADAEERAGRDLGDETVARHKDPRDAGDDLTDRG